MENTVVESGDERVIHAGRQRRIFDGKIGMVNRTEQAAAAK